jgi:hypothetical protein
MVVAGERASGLLRRAQDTFYVGNLKGVGRVYQQTFIDIYAKVVCAKLYDRKARQSPRRICSTTGCCRSSRSTTSSCCAC